MAMVIATAKNPQRKSSACKRRSIATILGAGSAFPAANDHKVLLSIGFVWLVTIANLRGARESGTLFAVPTYGFVAAIMATIAIGLYQCVGACPATAPVEPIANWTYALRAKWPGQPPYTIATRTITVDVPAHVTIDGGHRFLGLARDVQFLGSQ